jgi:GNAT superfamily N-acetyltransferase
LSSIIPDSELIIKALNENYDLSSFYCTDSDLNDFLKNDALDYHKNMISKTSLCFWKNELAGYITFTIDSIGIKKVNINNEFMSKFSYPALKIARLAVDSRFERRGIGKYLLQFALGIAWSISESASCRLVLVDSKKDSIPFYEKYGFRKAILKHGDKKDDFTPMYRDLLPLILKISSQVEGKGDSTANPVLIHELKSEVSGTGSSTANIVLLKMDDKENTS